MSDPKADTCQHCGADPLVTEDRCVACGEPFGLSGEDGNGYNCTCVACGKSNMWVSCCAACGEEVDE